VYFVRPYIDIELCITKKFDVFETYLIQNAYI